MERESEGRRDEGRDRQGIIKLNRKLSSNGVAVLSDAMWAPLRLGRRTSGRAEVEKLRKSPG